MKKILIALSVFIMVACGDSKPKYKSYTPVDKYNMLVKVAEEKDEKLKAEIQENIKNLKKAVEKNDEKARQELTEWQGLLLTVDVDIEG
ncbi:hypothetical protein [Fusobacterium sp. oral taxon 203]|jgi:lipoprotein|uniref:hypothetical protein n=1 Tax=Fusobacterium sp. oral taxon 203 TaxID=671211 RepID=UPI000B926595|nr:hypothetical protein [Fusobacterium sp. oral taxon 203]ASS39763.1 hypothetical protein AXF16_06660 [Fusobacterium sp. oral taxon 203]